MDSYKSFHNEFSINKITSWVDWFLFVSIFKFIRLFEGSDLVESIFPVKVCAHIIAISHFFSFTDLILSQNLKSSLFFRIFRSSSPARPKDLDKVFDFCNFILNSIDTVFLLEQKYLVIGTIPIFAPELAHSPQDFLSSIIHSSTLQLNFIDLFRRQFVGFLFGKHFFGLL